MASTVHRRQAPQNALVALDATAETGNLQRTLQAFEMLPVLGQTQVRAYNIGQLFFQRRSCDKQFWLNDINPSDYFRASCELWSSFPYVEIQKNPVFPKTFESNIIIGILPAEKLWKDEHSKVLDCESREDSNSSKCRCSWSTSQHPLKIFAKCHVSPWNGSNLSLLPPSKWRFRMGSPNLNTWWSLESWEWAAFNPNLPGCWGLLCVTHGHWESYQAWSYPNRVGRSHSSLRNPVEISDFKFWFVIFFGGT